MTRHPCLQPLSRDHYATLVQARHLEREPTNSRLKDFLAVWQEEIDDHLFEEERILLKFATPEQGSRLINDHMIFRQYVDAGRRGMLGDTDIARLGRLLYDHVRWEERKLFPAIEQSLTDTELEGVAEETRKLEGRRPRSQPARTN